MNDVTTETYDELATTGHVLLDIWGPDCAPCIAMMPAVEEILRVTVDLAHDRQADAATIACSIRDQLLRLNSEFAHYVPGDHQLPDVQLRPAGDPEYFPIGVKHRYTRRH